MYVLGMLLLAYFLALPTLVHSLGPAEVTNKSSVSGLGDALRLIDDCAVPGTVALTFGGGPDRYTNRVLDVLDKHKAKATIFIADTRGHRGQIDDPDFPLLKVIQRMQQNGYHVVSHTRSRQNMNNPSTGDRFEELANNQTVLENFLNLTDNMLQKLSDSGYRAVTLEECLDDLGDFLYRRDTIPIPTEKDSASQSVDLCESYCASDCQKGDTYCALRSASYIALTAVKNNSTAADSTLPEVSVNGSGEGYIGDVMHDPFNAEVPQDANESSSLGEASSFGSKSLVVGFGIISMVFALDTLLFM